MKTFLKEFLLENWSLKLTALLLALILWLFIRGEPGPERVVAIPLEVQLPRQMEITNPRPASVEVTLRGAAFSNILFNQPLPTCIIDLSDAKEGEHVITLTPENVRTPKGSGIEVLQVSPIRVALVLERTISEEVPIAVKLRGEPPKGFEIYDKFPKPRSVVITGPRSRVQAITEMPTEAVPIEGQKEPVRFFAALDVPDNSIRLQTHEPVQVQVVIGPRRKLTTIAKVPVETDDPSLTTSPKQLSVHVLAPVDLIEKLTPADFHAMVTTRNIDTSKLPIKVEPRVTITGNNPLGAMIIREIVPAEVALRRNPQ